MQSLILKENGKESANIYLKDTSYSYIWTGNDADIASSNLTTFLRVLKLKLAASMFFIVRHSFLYNLWRTVSLRAGHQANSPFYPPRVVHVYSFKSFLPGKFFTLEAVLFSLSYSSLPRYPSAESWYPVFLAFLWCQVHCLSPCLAKTL